MTFVNVPDARCEDDVRQCMKECLAPAVHSNDDSQIINAIATCSAKCGTTQGLGTGAGSSNHVSFIQCSNECSRQAKEVRGAGGTFDMEQCLSDCGFGDF